MFRKTCSEHRSFTLRLLFGRFILNHIPVLGEEAVLDANNVCGNPIRRLAMPRKPSVDDDEISLRDNHVVFILQRWRDALDEIEQAVTTRLDMSTVLNVVRRPITLSRYVITLIEQRVKSCKNKRFVFRFNRLTHFYSPARCTMRLLPTSTIRIPKAASDHRAVLPPSTAIVAPLMQDALP